MKTIFIGVTLFLTIVITIVLIIDDMNSFRYVFAGFNYNILFVPVVGIILAMMFAAIPDNNNNNKENK